MLKLRIYQHICANEDLFVLVGCAKTDPAAQMVSDQIAEMKESGSYSLQDIEKAKERYNSLTDDQKKHVDIDKTIELVKVGLMTPNEAREAIGEDFGLARIEDNQLLDEFYYNGEPLKAKFQADDKLFGVDTILEGLENNWEDETLEEEISSEEDSAFQKVIKSIRQSYKRD